jgi:glycosyltransferase involved in cell wall biosynthesis
MKILLLTDGISPFVVGGMQRHSYFLAKWLVKTGNQVVLYHCVPEGKAEVSLDTLISALDLIEGEEERLEAFCVTFPKSDIFPGHYLRASKKLSDVYLKHYTDTQPSVDFIYSKGFAAYSFLKAREKGVSLPPVGVKLHGLNMYQPSANLKTRLQSLMLRFYSDYLLAKADILFSYGGHITELLLRLNVSARRIIEMPTGIEGDWLVSAESLEPESEIKVCFVGRFDRVKGLPELYASLQMWDNKVPWTLFLAGPIPEKNQIHHPRVFYMGSITAARDMKDFLQGCHIIVCPSFSEGMPNAVLEAMASGCAVVATDTGAVSMLVNTDTGVLISTPQPKKIAEGINSLLHLNTLELLAKRRAAVQHIRENFLWELLSERLSDQLSQHPVLKRA